MNPCDLHRRHLTLGALGGLGLAALPWASRADEVSRQQAYVNALRQGNCIALIRHATTVAGIGDPAGMRLEDCSTQRNLSEEGRSQSRRIGRWFASHKLAPTQVRSSQWCRCLDTASIAFSREIIGEDLQVTPWVALNSFFQGHGDRRRQLQEAMLAARAIAMRRSYGQFEVWVTHHVVIGSLTGLYPSSGEMVVARYTEPDRPLAVLASGLVF
jgi:hypothetical protein